MVGVALVALVLALVVVLSEQGERLAGTNFVKPVAFSVTVPPGEETCQRTLLTDDAQRVVVLVGTFGRPVPPLTLRFADADGRTVARGRAAAGGEGYVTIPLDRRVDGNRVDASACLRNGGRHRIVLGGDIAHPPHSATVAGTPTEGIVAYRYLRPGSESWWAIVPTIATRMGLGKVSWFGPWTLPLAAILLVGCWAAAIWLLLRAER